jgi:hypothetical protein
MPRRGVTKPTLRGVPDLRFINRRIEITEVARALDLKIGDNGNIHCWHPELHLKMATEQPRSAFARPITQ